MPRAVAYFSTLVGWDSLRSLRRIHALLPHFHLTRCFHLQVVFLSFLLPFFWSHTYQIWLSPSCSSDDQQYKQKIFLKPSSSTCDSMCLSITLAVYSFTSPSSNSTLYVTVFNCCYSLYVPVILSSGSIDLPMILASSILSRCLIIDSNVLPSQFVIHLS